MTTFLPKQSRLIETNGSIYDIILLSTVLFLILFGVVMVASSSLHIADKQMNDPLFYTSRQACFAMIGLLAGFAMMNIPLYVWQRMGPLLLIIGLILLVVVLIPGLGKVVNGSYRWISFGVFNLQVSELFKLLMIIYISGYLVRHANTVHRQVKGFLFPMVLLLITCVFLLLEPDFGSSAIIVATTLGMMFLGGAKLKPFFIMLLVIGFGFLLLVLFSPYRLARALAFIDPWKNQYGDGYQLIQALIAFGRGDLLGVGLGNSVQKIFYLPEAHTDFLVSVLAEELGIFAVILVIVAFSLIIWRSFLIGALAEQMKMRFHAFLAYGVGIWLGLQSFINLGVNMGLLPTKGLTLPFMSYGGSSLIIACIAIGIVLRVRMEVIQSVQNVGKDSKAWVCM